MLWWRLKEKREEILELLAIAPALEEYDSKHQDKK